MTSENTTGTNLQEAPSQDGVFSVEGMRGLSQLRRSEIDRFNKEMEQLPWGRSAPRYIGGAIGNLVPTDFGESKYDKELAVQDVLSGDKTLNQLRAEKQSAGAKYGNGLIGLLTRSGTTFVRGAIGILYGSGQALNEGRFSAVWDNDINNAMDSWDAFVDEQTPIYLTKYEEDHPWKTVLSAGNIANNILKNAGFVIGAILSGQMYSGIIQGLGIASKIGSGVASINTATRTSNAAKAGYELAKATMQRQAAGVGTQALVSTMSAIGEGSYEAANNSRLYEESQVQTRRAEFNELMNRPEVQRELLNATSSMVSLDDFTVITLEGQRVIDYEGYRQAVQEAYDTLVNNRWAEIRAEIHDTALKMGNADMLMNIPILAISNWVQFGRLFRGGFKANKTAAKIKGNFTDGFRTATGKAARAKIIGAALLSPATEGFEEMNQSAVAEGASIWTSSELDSFIDDRYDPDSERETSDFLSSIWNGLVDTYSNPDNWLEFTYGAAMGIIPMPIAKRRSNGRIGVDLNWEMLNKIRDSREAMAEAQQLTEYLNNRAQDPNFQSNWNALVANTNMQARMNRTVADPFNFKNYEHRQAVHDLIAIDKAGKLDLFKEQLQDWASQPNTKEFIDNLKDASTEESGRSWMDGMSSEEIYDTYQRNAKDLLNTVEFFGQASRNIRTTYGDIFTEDALDEMVYIRTQIQNWQDRANAIRQSVGSKAAPSLLRAVEGIEISDSQRDLLNWIGSSTQDLAILKEKDFDNVSKFLEAVVNNSDIVDKDQTLRDLTDLLRISVSISNGIETYNKHISNPERLNKKIEKKKTERTKEIKKGEDAETVTTVAQNLSNATTYSDMVDILAAQELPDLSTIDLEGAQVIRDAKNTIQKVETARRVATNRAQSTKNPVDIAAQSLIEMITEQMPEDMALDPESAQEVYGSALQEAIANRIIDVPEGLAETFTSDVVDAAEEALRAFQEEQQRLASVPDVDVESIPEDLGNIDLEGATVVEELSTSTPPVDTKLSKNVEDVDKPMPEITVGEARALAESPRVDGPGRYMLYTAVPEIHKEAAKFADGGNVLVTPTDPDWEKWEKIYDPKRTPTDLKEIYLRLQAFGAFDYLRSHVITPGTEVFYVADTRFRGPDPDKFGIPIFYAIKDSSTQELQIIGAAPSYKLSNVQSLKEVGQSLEDKAKNITTPGLLVSNITTKVSIVNDGTFIRSNPSISTVDSSFIGNTDVSIGVVVNGQIYNKNGSVSRNLLSTSVGDFAKYNGRPLLLIRATSGKYKIMPLRTKKLGTGPSDISIQNTENPIIQQLTKSAGDIVSSTNTEEVKKAILDLKASLYLPNIYIRASSDQAGNRVLLFSAKGEDNKYHNIIEPVPIADAIGTLNKETAVNNILQALVSLGPMFQISPRLLENNPAYEKFYIDSGILYTDIDSPKIYNTWMIFEDGAKSPAEERQELKEALTPVTEISLGRKTYRSSPEGWRSSDGSLVVDPRTVAALNRKYMADNTPKASIPKPAIQTMNTFGVGRVGTPRVRPAKQEGTTQVSKSQKDLENTNNLFIFAKLDEKQRESLISKGISEAEFNAMSREQQDKIIDCYS